MVIKQFPVAGDVARRVQAPVTVMFPFGGAKTKRKQPHRLFYHFTTRTLYSCSLHHTASPWNWWEQNWDFKSVKWEVCVFILFLVSHFTDFQQSLKRKQKSRKGGGSSIQMHGSVLSLCTWGQTGTCGAPGRRLVAFFYSDLWQYKSLRALSSSMRVLFWFSSTATRFSRHLTYSFFFLRHSRAASLWHKNHVWVCVCN